MLLLLKIPPKHGAEVWSRVPKGIKAVMCVSEKTRVLDELHGCLSCSAVGCEFNINESTI